MIFRHRLLHLECASGKGGSEEVKLRSFTTKIHKVRQMEMEHMGLSDSMGDTMKWPFFEMGH